MVAIAIIRINLTRAHHFDRARAEQGLVMPTGQLGDLLLGGHPREIFERESPVEIPQKQKECSAPTHLP